jgi:methylthioribose-1-phosphate isomerase
MRVQGVDYRTITLAPDGWSVSVIDQTQLPFEFVLCRLQTVADAAAAICSMVVRGAPLIGVTAAYGVALAMRADPSDASLRHALGLLAGTRPTAINLRWSLARMDGVLQATRVQARAERAYVEALAIADEDVAACAAIGRYGEAMLRGLAADRAGQPLRVLTHCNAGWLACVDWGTALAPVYAAHDAGVPLHVYVDETRPRNQGAALTAFELGAHGVPYTVIADNAGGHLMQQGEIDLCLVGSDRVTPNGDVVNKIGTYLKALAAHDNGVPFYAALPGSTIDWSFAGDPAGIPIEQRAARELTHVRGRSGDGCLLEVEVVAANSPVANPAFDVTPSRLVTALITERGIAPATREGLCTLYPERAGSTGQIDEPTGA